MIQIDMNRKHNMNVINKSFHLENDVLVLAVKPLEYDLEGKTITAVFEPSKVETGALEVVNGLIQLPINNALVQPGVNYIQFNFRWGETKLEQSGKLMWIIDKSLETNSPAQEDVDIISYLISEINASKVTVDRMVDDAGDVKLALDASVEQAGESKTALDGSVTLAGTMKDELDGSITSATNINNALADPVDGTMKQANDSRVALEGKITDAGTAKSEIEQAIVDNQIVKQSEFTEHKLDYANLANDVKELSYITQKYTIDSWQKVQELVRAGLADKAFRIGDQLIANYNGTPYTWDVIGINHDIPTDTNHVHSLTIQAHDCIMNCQLDAPEALYYAEVELPAGDYYFINSYEASKAYQLSLANAVPAGGIIFISGWATNSPTQIKTFADNITTTAIETVAIAEGSAGAQLSTINDIRRCQYGSSNYIESNIRQWLNSQDSSFIWDRTTNYSKPSTAAPYTGGGFLSLLDPELVEVIGAVDKQVTRNTITDGGGQDLFSDKVFLLSRKEVFGGDEGAVTGEIPYPWYSALAANPTADPLTGRIKYLSGSAHHWWLRSPVTGISSIPRIVYTTGNVSYNSAYYASGLAPACCIV